MGTQMRFQSTEILLLNSGFPFGFGFGFQMVIKKHHVDTAAALSMSSFELTVISVLKLKVCFPGG